MTHTRIRPPPGERKKIFTRPDFRKQTNILFWPEAAVHAMCNIFEEDDCDAFLLVDAENAFNSINRCAKLISGLCPIASVYAYNYARPFAVGGKELKSKEGMTQEDPVSRSKR